MIHSLKSLPSELQALCRYQHQRFSTTLVHPQPAWASTSGPRYAIVTERTRQPPAIEAEAEFDFLEPKTEEYKPIQPVYRSSLSKPIKSYKDAVLAFLDQKNPKRALTLVDKAVDAGEPIEPDFAFLFHARKALKEGSVERFLLWFSFVPPLLPAQVVGLDPVPGQVIRELVKLNKILLAHTASPELLRRCVKMAAERSLAPYMQKTYQSIALLLPPGQLAAYLQETRRTIIQRARQPTPDVSVSTFTRHLKYQRDQATSCILRFRCRAGYVSEVVDWLTASGTDGRRARAIKDGSLSGQTYRFILMHLTFQLRDSRLPAETRRKYEQLHAALEEKVLGIASTPTARDNEMARLEAATQWTPVDVGLSYETVSNMPYKVALEAVDVAKAKFGIHAMSPQALAGLIASWSNEGHPPKKLPGLTLGQQSSMLDPEARLWATAYCAFYDRKHMTAALLSYFHDTFLAVGPLPSQYTNHIATLGVPPSKHLLFPTREALRTVLAATLRHLQVKRHSRSPQYAAAVFECYQSFLARCDACDFPSFLSPDPKMFQSFLEALSALQTEHGRCFKVVRDMQARGISPSLHNWTSVLRAASGDPQQTQLALHILGRMESGQPPEPGSALAEFPRLPPPTMVAYVLAMHGFLSSQQPALALVVQQRMVAFLGPAVVGDEVAKGREMASLVERVAREARQMATRQDQRSEAKALEAIQLGDA